MLFAALCVAVPVLTLIRAPYLPRLVLEEYPAQRWPAPGSFARVAGVLLAAGEIAADFDGAKFDPRGKRLFEEKEGAALLNRHYTER